MRTLNNHFDHVNLIGDITGITLIGWSCWYRRNIRPGGRYSP